MRKLSLRTYFSKADIDYCVRFVFLFLLCFMTAQFAVELFQEGTAPAVLYLPAAIGLTAVFLWGYGLWPAIALASLLNSFVLGGTPVLGISLALGHTFQAVIGAYLLKRFDFQPLLGRLQDLFVFAGVSIVTAAFTPFLGSVGSILSAELIGTSPLGISPLHWWIGELFSLILFGPFFIRWLAYPKPSKRTSQMWTETALTLAALFVMAWILFWTPYSSVVGVSLIYLMLVPLFWIALRVGPRFMTFALVMMTLIAMVGTPLGEHPQSTQTIGERLFSIELFMIFIAAVFLILTAAAEERKDALQNLLRHVFDLEDALAKIHREDQAKADFLATLAHELRNPLSPILSSLELIDRHASRGGSVEEITPHFKSIQTHVGMITRLLDDLLDINRITRKKFKLYKTSLELKPIMAQAAETVGPFYAEHNHTLHVQFPHEDLWLEADPLRLQQIIVNILYNAGKYSEPGGVMTLSAKRKNDFVEIRTKDQGIGIAPDMLKKIFEPFVQGGQGKVGTGLGIGLSLTKRLSELHGGFVRAESDGVGKGSEFIVTLPLARTAQLAMPLERSRGLFTVGGRKAKSILLVDDNKPAAQSLGALLSEQGYAVDTAYTGTEALMKLSNGSRPDVVILDIGLPDMDGYTVAREMKKENTHTHPVLVALTGYGQDDDKRKARAAGIEYHLTKPVGLSELEGVLSKITPTHA